VIPPECDSEFVANIEDVLGVFERLCYAEIPVLCTRTRNQSNGSKK
jgi:hypothetical protein